MTIGERLYDVNTLDHNTASSADTPSRDSLEKDVEEGNERRGSHPSISVPIIWGNDLTPFFHLDLSAALAAATEGIGEDSQLSSSIDKTN